MARWLTLPNAFTVLRLAGTAPLVGRILRGRFGPATGAGLAVWAGTDWIDGFLARRLGQGSETGRHLDPVADRLGVAVLAWALVRSKALHPVFPVTIVGTDLLVLAATRRAVRTRQLRVSRLGKARTVVLFLALVLAAWTGPGRRPAARCCLWLAGTGTLLHVTAGIGYIRAARVSTRGGSNGAQPPRSG